MFNERSGDEKYRWVVVILELTGHSPHSSFRRSEGKANQLYSTVVS